MWYSVFSSNLAPYLGARQSKLGRTIPWDHFSGLYPNYTEPNRLHLCMTTSPSFLLIPDKCYINFLNGRPWVMGLYSVQTLMLWNGKDNRRGRTNMKWTDLLAEFTTFIFERPKQGCWWWDLSEIFNSKVLEGFESLVYLFVVYLFVLCLRLMFLDIAEIVWIWTVNVYVFSLYNLV